MKRKILLLSMTAALVLSGCSAGDDDASKNGDASPVVTVPPVIEVTTPEELPAVVEKDLPIPVSMEEEGKPKEIVIPAGSTVTATEDLTHPKCTSNSFGRWDFAGIITNPSEEDRTYTVTVTVKSGEETKAHATVAQEVPAGSVYRVVHDNFAEVTDKDATCDAVASLIG